MNFRSVNDLNTAIINGLTRIPRDIQLVAGIPRSGLLAANLFAQYLELPLTDLDGLTEQRVFTMGHTRTIHPEGFKWSDCKKVLLVDDSVTSGRSMNQARYKLASANLDLEVKYCGIYVTEESRSVVDIYIEVCPHPRFFQWNLMQHNILSKACVDIDGVLCRDPRPEENDDGSNYETFLLETEPIFIPRREIGYLVTSRLEKYRFHTETWLKRHGIRYRHLMMLDLPTKEERIRKGAHSIFKAETYAQSDALIFVESSLQQAKEIVEFSQKPAIAIETWQLIQPQLKPKEASTKNLPPTRSNSQTNYKPHGHK